MAEALEKALSINPTLLDALNWLSIGIDGQGSLAIIEKMLEIDPLFFRAICAGLAFG